MLFCTTKLAQSALQNYSVLESLHKALPSTTLCYKARTKYFPVLLCTTKLPRSSSQYYFALHTLQAITMRFAASRGLYRRTWQQKMTTIMRPFHCDLQPRIPSAPRTTMNHAHTNNRAVQNTVEEPTTRQSDRSRTNLSHELPFIDGCSHFTRKNTMFRAPASSPHHFPKSPLPKVTTSRSHHSPKSPLPLVTTSPFPKLTQ